MKTIKKIVSVFVGLCILINIIPMNAFAVVTDNRVAASWEIEVQSIEFYDELYTEETVINYDGSTQVLKHHNTPSNGKIYVVATIDVEKQDVFG